MGKVPSWECLFVHRKQGLFLSVYVDDFKMAGRKENMDYMLKKLMKNVDLDEPTSFLDNVYLGCNQRDANRMTLQRCLNHVFLLQQLKSYQGGKTSPKNSRMVLRHGKTCSKMH